MLPSSFQDVDLNDIKSVVKVLKSNYLTQGPFIEKFEKKVSNLVNSKYSIAVNSATSALHISCIALGVGKNDLVWTVPNTFVSSANCALHCGAKIDFVDIDSNTFNMCISSLEKKLKNCLKEKKQLPKILITVDFAGLPIDLKKIYSLSKKYNFKIISDSSHSLGSYFNKTPVGNSKYANITIFSFHAVKNITTGEGGMALTKDKKIYNKLKMLRTHGITRDKKQFKSKKYSPAHYEQHLLGFNYRMTDFQAALGISQLSKLTKFIKKRNYLAKIYINNLQNLPLKYQKVEKNCLSSYHLFLIVLDLKKIKRSYNQIFTYLKNKNILVNKHYPCVHLQPYYKKLGFKKNMFLNSEAYEKAAISLPIATTMTKKNIIYITNALKEIIK